MNPRVPDGIWRRLPDDIGSSDLHFRQSDALVRRSTVPTLWWHSTDRPTLILGAGQTSFDISRCEKAGVLIVRRHAGGTAVYADASVVGLDIMLPVGYPLADSDILETYRWLGQVWDETFSRLGIPTRVVGVSEVRKAAASIPPDAAVRVACFGTLSPHEVVVGTRKLVGLAQVRRRNGILLQSAFHLHFNPERLATLVGITESNDIDALRRSAVGLDELSSVEHDRVVLEFETVLQAHLGVRLAPGEWSADEVAHFTAGETAAALLTRS